MRAREWMLTSNVNRPPVTFKCLRQLHQTLMWTLKGTSWGSKTHNFTKAPKIREELLFPSQLIMSTDARFIPQPFENKLKYSPETVGTFVTPGPSARWASKEAPPPSALILSPEGILSTGKNEQMSSLRADKCLPACFWKRANKPLQQQLLGMFERQQRGIIGLTVRGDKM